MKAHIDSMCAFTPEQEVPTIDITWSDDDMLVLGLVGYSVLGSNGYLCASDDIYCDTFTHHLQWTLTKL